MEFDLKFLKMKIIYQFIIW